MRARTDPIFTEFLLHVGNKDEPTIRDNLILIPEQLTFKHCRDGIPEESIIKEIFPNLQENATRKKYVTERAILASRNGHMHNLNDKLISTFPCESKTFNSFDSTENDTNNYYQEESLNTLTPNSLPPHRIKGKCTYYVAKEFRPFKWLMQWHPNDMLRLCPECLACQNIKWSLCNKACVSSQNSTVTTRK
ncbi:hypothetical protein H5410_041000 [Solanum commersonii]|uniref:ATP-dependent DNA helicase n=1 Tax=Solanum commersonii TaxID=4109 RepID=A0A9J5XU72_SOLCO|nr:hypothetical protein H5410_041000 [Solanum commersonii]